MRVAIAGAGSVGRSIAKELLGNGHEVLLIDKDPRKIKVYNVPNAEWLLADACEISSLEDASLERCNVVIAAHDNDIREQFLEWRGEFRADGRRAPDHAAQEPAGAVDAEEADRFQLPATALSARMQPRMQLGAERALRILSAAARLRHLGRELLPHLVP